MRHFTICLLILLLQLTCSGCNDLAEWRDQQVKTSHELGEGSRIVIPDPPIQVPKQLYSTLPIRDDFTILTHREDKNAGHIEIDALVDQELDSLSVWLITRFADLGYGSGDNASRILEGTTYRPTRTDTVFSAVYIKVDVADSGRSLLHLKAFKER